MAREQFYVEFGAKLATARRFAGLTQNELASKIGISRGALANVEAGRQRVLLHQLLEFADALGLRSFAELMPYEIGHLSDSGQLDPDMARIDNPTLSDDQRSQVAEILKRFS